MQVWCHKWILFVVLLRLCKSGFAEDGVTSDPEFNPNPVNRASYSFNSSEEDARIDLLFVFDSSDSNTGYYAEMKRAAPDFFARLDQAKVRYSLSAISARDFRGRPLYSPGAKSLITSINSHAAEDFSGMIDSARSAEELMSAAWSMDRFLVETIGIRNPFGREFFSPGVPLLAFAHVFGRDQIKLAARNTRAERVKPSDIGRGFRNYMAYFEKPFQLYFNDISCDANANREYSEMAAPSYGQALSWNACTPPGTCMREFADIVIGQAARYKWSRFPLAKRPDVARLKVSLQTGKGRLDLTGNTGLSKDQWRYDSQGNFVKVHWWNIQWKYDQTRDKLEIEY